MPRACDRWSLHRGKCPAFPTGNFIWSTNYVLRHSGSVFHRQKGLCGPLKRYTVVMVEEMEGTTRSVNDIIALISNQKDPYTSSEHLKWCSSS